MKSETDQSSSCRWSDGISI